MYTFSQLDIMTATVIHNKIHTIVVTCILKVFRGKVGILVH